MLDHLRVVLSKGYMHEQDKSRIVKVEFTSYKKFVTYRIAHDGRVYRYEHNIQRVSIDNSTLEELCDELSRDKDYVQRVRIKYADHGSEWYMTR